MGYSTRIVGTRGNASFGEIKTFTPDDTDTELYIRANYESISLQEVLDKIQEKWPGVTMDKIEIQAEHIHTDCIGYDRYDSGDHTNYLHITKTA